MRQSPAGSDCASCPSSRSVPKPRARKVPGRAGQRHGRSPYGFAAPRCSEVLSTNEAKRARSAWLRSYPSTGPTPQDESTTRVPSSPAQPPGSPHSPCSSRAGNRYRIRLPYGTNISALRAGAATAHSGPCRAQRRAGQPMAGARGRAAGGAAARPGHTASPSGTRPSLLSSGSARRLLTRIHEARRRLRFIFLLPAGGGGVGRWGLPRCRRREGWRAGWRDGPWGVRRRAGAGRGAGGCVVGEGGRCWGGPSAAVWFSAGTVRLCVAVGRGTEVEERKRFGRGSPHKLDVLKNRRLSCRL